MRLLYDCGTAVLCDFLQQSKKSVIFASFSGLQHSYSTAQHEKSYRLWSVQHSYSTAQHEKTHRFTDGCCIAVSDFLECCITVYSIYTAHAVHVLLLCHVSSYKCCAVLLLFGIVLVPRTSLVHSIFFCFSSAFKNNRRTDTRLLVCTHAIRS